MWCKSPVPFLSQWISSFSTIFTKDIVFLHCVFLTILMKMNCLSMCGFILFLTSLSCFICLHICFYVSTPVLCFLMALGHSLESESMLPPTLFFKVKISLFIQDLWGSQMDFYIIFLFIWKMVLECDRNSNESINHI